MKGQVRPGYKQTEVGVIPEDWAELTFGYLYAEPSRNGIYKTSVFHGRGTRIVNMGEMFGFEFISDQEMSRVELTNRERSVCVLQDGDLLFGRRSVVPAGAGKCSLVVSPSESITFESSIIRARLDKTKTHPRYYYYFFASPAGRSVVGTIVSGTNIKGIRATELKELIVPLPSKAEQEAIAEALRDADALIESLEQLLTKKRHLKQGAMQELLNGKKRLPGFGGEWEARKLGDVIEKFVGGGTPSRSNAHYWGDEIPWVTVKDFATFDPLCSQEAITRAGLHNSATHLIPRGTLITSTRMALGKAVIYEVDVAINQDLKALFPRPVLDTNYLFFWFQYHGKSIDELGSGSTVKGISLPDLKKIEFQLPPCPEQRAISSTLSDMDAEIADLETQLTKTRTLKQGMMHKLLTGEIRLL